MACTHDAPERLRPAGGAPYREYRYTGKELDPDHIGS
jgi:hypothetical protein